MNSNPLDEILALSREASLITSDPIGQPHISLSVGMDQLSLATETQSKGRLEEAVM